MVVRRLNWWPAAEVAVTSALTEEEVMSASITCTALQACFLNWRTGSFLSFESQI